MDKSSKANIPESSPKDRSLAAYKAWIIEIARRLTTGKTELPLTDEEWVKNWKEYWKQRIDS